MLRDQHDAMLVGHIGRTAGFAPIGFELVEFHLDDHDTQRPVGIADTPGDVETGAIADIAERKMLGRSLLHRPAEVVAEGIVVADEAQPVRANCSMPIATPSLPVT